MSEGDLSLVPLEARRYQGVTAGIVTRVAANTVDGLVVASVLVGAWLGYTAIRFILAPRNFELPAPTLVWVIFGYFDVLVVYLTAAWWISGRTIGNHVMGIRVVTGTRRRLRLARSFSRALMCAFFPIGLLWCVVDPRRRSIQDLLLRTSVIYDWLPRPASVKVPPSSGA